MRILLQHTFKILLCILLLQFSSTAFSFTLIQEALTPSSTITDSTTLKTQIQPTPVAIKAHLNSKRHVNKPAKKAQKGNVLAANSYVSSINDLDYMTLGYNDQVSAGNAEESGEVKNLWINSAYSALKNDFSQSLFDGNVHVLVMGYDYTLSDKYIFGVALSHETSNFNTRFNLGNEQTNGINISPYFAVLLSETWSFDISLGHGKFNTGQYRTYSVSPASAADIVSSDFASSRDFASINFTKVASWSNWKLTGSIGLLVAKQDQDSYVESKGGAVVASSQRIEQRNIASEVAYSHLDSESYVGLIYENAKDPEKIKFITDKQPADDTDSFLLTAGWRHFGKDLTANFMFSTRLGQDNITDNSFSTTLRFDL